MKIRVLQRTPSAYVTPADDALGLAMHWQFFDCAVRRTLTAAAASGGCP
jgi:hypothetical protein